METLDKILPPNSLRESGACCIIIVDKSTVGLDLHALARVLMLERLSRKEQFHKFIEHDNLSA